MESGFPEAQVRHSEPDPLEAAMEDVSPAPSTSHPSKTSHQSNPVINQNQSSIKSQEVKNLPVFEGFGLQRLDVVEHALG